MIPNKTIQHKWLQALENTDIEEGRLHRGKEYVWSGNVEELDINGNEVSAEIEGNYGNYEVQIKFKQLNQAQIEQVNEIVESDPDISAEINSGNIPYNLFDLLEAKNIFLIPENFDDYCSDCDCPDDTHPCKHIVAVYYAISQEISEIPLLLFVLNGLPVNNPEFKIEKSFKTQAREKLENLLRKADKETLKQIIIDLTFKSKDNYRKCLDIIEDSMNLEDEEKAECSSEKFMTIWDEVKWKIKKIEEYGYSGDYFEDDEIQGELAEIKEELEKGKASKNARNEFINDAMSYIDTDFGGGVLDCIHVACYDKDELRSLALEIEDSHNNRSMTIYKELADKDKYLELRLKNLENSRDYYDLVEFYEENNESDKAVKTAYECLQKVQYGKDDLLDYLAKKALDSNNRIEYLRLKFEKYGKHLTFESYKSFKSICTEEEWKQYEPEILIKLDKTYQNDKMLIYMHRQEFDKAVNILVQIREGWHYFNMQSAGFLTAEKLKEKYPEQVLQFYMNSIGDLDLAKDRKIYANQAKVAAKIQDIYENIMKTPEKWVEFAKNTKYKNKNRKAFQEEFGKVIKGWGSL